MQTLFPWAVAVDVVVRRPAQLQHAAERQPQRRGLRRHVPAGEPGRDAGAESRARRHGDLGGSDAGVSRLRIDYAAVGPRLAHVPLAPALVPAPLQERLLVRIQRHDQPLRSPEHRARLQHNPDGSYSIRGDQAEGGRAPRNGHQHPAHHEGNFVWDLPDIRSDRPVFKAIGLLVNDWRLSSIWTGGTAARTASDTATRAASATRMSPGRRTTADASGSSAIRAAAAAAIRTGNSIPRRLKARSATAWAWSRGTTTCASAS